jgi:hypothetical protein
MQELRLVRLNNGNFAESWIKPSTSASLRNLRYNTCADLQQDHGLLFPYGSLHCNIVIMWELCIIYQQCNLKFSMMLKVTLKDWNLKSLDHFCVSISIFSNKIQHLRQILDIHLINLTINLVGYSSLFALVNKKVILTFNYL